MKMLNPEVRREAEWFDGRPTDRDLADLAARKGLPLWVEAPVRPYATWRPPNVDGKRTLLRCAEFRLREAKALLVRAEADVAKCRAALEAEEAADKGEAA